MCPPNKPIEHINLYKDTTRFAFPPNPIYIDPPLYRTSCAPQVIDYTSKTGCKPYVAKNYTPYGELRIRPNGVIAPPLNPNEAAESEALAGFLYSLYLDRDNAIKPRLVAHSQKVYFISRLIKDSTNLSRALYMATPPPWQNFCASAVVSIFLKENDLKLENFICDKDKVYRVDFAETFWLTYPIGLYLFNPYFLSAICYKKEFSDYLVKNKIPLTLNKCSIPDDYICPPLIQLIATNFKNCLAEVVITIAKILKTSQKEQAEIFLLFKLKSQQLNKEFHEGWLERKQEELSCQRKKLQAMIENSLRTTPDFIVSLRENLAGHGEGNKALDWLLTAQLAQTP